MVNSGGSPRRLRQVTFGHHRVCVRRLGGPGPPYGCQEISQVPSAPMLERGITLTRHPRLALTVYTARFIFQVIGAGESLGG